MRLASTYVATMVLVALMGLPGRALACLCAPPLDNALPVADTPIVPGADSPPPAPRLRNLMVYRYDGRPPQYSCAKSSCGCTPLTGTVVVLEIESAATEMDPPSASAYLLEFEDLTAPGWPEGAVRAENGVIEVYLGASDVNLDGSVQVRALAPNGALSAPLLVRVLDSPPNGCRVQSSGASGSIALLVLTLILVYRRRA